jgi:hypothetical protein
LNNKYAVKVVVLVASLSLLSGIAPAAAVPTVPLFFQGTSGGSAIGSEGSVVIDSTVGELTVANPYNTMSEIKGFGAATFTATAAGSNGGIKFLFSGTGTNYPIPFNFLGVGWDFTVNATNLSPVDWQIIYQVGSSPISSATFSGNTPAFSRVKGITAMNLIPGTKTDIWSMELDVTMPSFQIGDQLSVTIPQNSIDINAAVPEPSSLLVVIPALAGLLVRRRKKATGLRSSHPRRRSTTN